MYGCLKFLETKGTTGNATQSGWRRHVSTVIWNWELRQHRKVLLASLRCFVRRETDEHRKHCKLCSSQNKFQFHIYSLTTRRWALLEEPPVLQLLKNVPTFYGTRRFITCSQESSTSPILSQINPVHTVVPWILRCVIYLIRKWC
jgi:hypothetical protein